MRQSWTGGSVATWPAEGHALWAELQSQPGRVALLIGEQADEPADRLAALVGSQVVSAGRLLADTFDSPPILVPFSHSASDRKGQSVGVSDVQVAGRYGQFRDNIRWISRPEEPAVLA